MRLPTSSVDMVILSIAENRFLMGRSRMFPASPESISKSSEGNALTYPARWNKQKETPSVFMTDTLLFFIERMLKIGK